MIRTITGLFRSIAALLFWIIIVPPAALIAFPWTFITGKAGFLYWVGMNLAYIGARIAYTALYITGIPLIRSLFWNIAAFGMLAVLAAPFVSY